MARIGSCRGVVLPDTEQQMYHGACAGGVQAWFQMAKSGAANRQAIGTRL